MVFPKQIRFYGKKKATYFNSIQMRKTFRPESSFETSFMLQQEFDDDVFAWAGQAQSFVFNIKGKLTRYTPDIIRRHKTPEGEKIEIIELKPNIFANNESVYTKHQLLSEQFLDRYNRPLTVHTEDDFYKPIKAENLARFYQYRAYDFSRYDLDLAFTHLTDIKCVGDLYEMCSRFNASPAFAPALIAQKKVHIDFEQPFSLDLPLEVTYG
ncbi:transposase [Pseudoalteromonas lipolytica]|uniref:transposase n=1 Tax=Pseudoalteromonas lipolytica TaxID=570156 RepID=UPI000C3B4297|nr:transposase [Pseudoalteromonas lipolytica]MAE01393.1 transposase [Pseudoalteromonas sp.]|tara:strand:- start:1061 stop:1693 length:633 start_codon:yes stop_codon:yes gene_type:complete